MGEVVDIFSKEEIVLHTEAISDEEYNRTMVHMTGNAIPKEEYDMDNEHIMAYLEDAKIQFERLARTIMHIESFISPR
jgi:hypothetical protein